MPTTSEDLRSPPTVEYAVDLLRELGEFVAHLPDATFAAAVPDLQSSSIGGHVRHILDHFSSWQQVNENAREGTAVPPLNYDARVRDRELETNRGLALGRLRRLADLIASARLGAVAWWLEGKFRPEDASFTMRTSAERELHYVALHCVHHMAVIAILARFQGAAVPADFGKARPTLWFEREQAAADAAV